MTDAPAPGSTADHEALRKAVETPAPLRRAKAYFDAIDQARAVSIYAKVSDLLSDAEIEGLLPGLEGALGRKVFNALYELRNDLDTRIRDQFIDLRMELSK